MNYHQPRQVDPTSDRPDAGKWRYTNMNDGRVWAEGYCAEDCPGHDTPEGAYEHQTLYEMDNARYDGQYVDQQFRCQAPACEAWTDRFAKVGRSGLQTFSLCDEHRNRDVVTALFGTVGDHFGRW